MERHNITDLFARNADDVLTWYTFELLDGITIHNKKIKVGTIKGYLDAVNEHYHENGQPKPFLNGAVGSRAAKLLKDAEEFEALPDRRMPLSPAMIHNIVITRTSNGEPFLGKDCAIADWTVICNEDGCRKQEFAQDKEDQVMVYITPTGDSVVRALTGNDFLFFDGIGNSLDIFAPGQRELIDSSLTVYKIQKNRQNMQKINHARNTANPEWCFIERQLRIMDRAKALGQPSDMPLGIFQDEDGSVKYLTGDLITEYLRDVARTIMPGLKEEDFNLYSTHSFRVTAAVLLQQAGKDGTFIKLRLRWKSDCFEVYLRNTKVISEQHRDALATAQAEWEARFS